MKSLIRRTVLCQPLAVLLLALPALAQAPLVANVTTVSTGPLALANPQAVAIDSAGNVYIADTFNNRVIMIAAGGAASVVAGTGSAGYSGDGLLANNAQLNQPTGLAVDPQGNIYVADSNNHRVRKFTVGGKISTVAGNGVAGFSGDFGLANNSQLNRPTGVAIDSNANLYITDSNNARVRVVTAGGFIQTAAGTGIIGFSGDNGPATAANLANPSGIAVDSSNNVYIADNFNRIRKFAPFGNILTVAGGGCCVLGDGGPATNAQLNGVTGVAVDAVGNIFIADTNDQRLRMVSAVSGFISTVDGTGVPGNAGNQLNNPKAVGLDAHGNPFVADSNNNRIQKIVFFEGTVSIGSASGGPGTVVQVPLTLTLNPGISIDSLGVTVQISSPAGGPLTFTPAPGISIPTFPPVATATSIVLGWNDGLSSVPGQPAVSASTQLGTIGVLIPAGAVIGSVINIGVTQVAGDLTGGNLSLIVVPLAAGPVGGPPPTIAVQVCSYLVGDAFPYGDAAVNNHCGQFGDNQLTFEDVIVALRVWGGVIVVPVCTDLFDALNAGPPDANGGPLSLADVQTTANRWANLDASRPRRNAGSYLQDDSTCSAQAGNAAAMMMASRRTRRPGSLDAPIAGAVELGPAEIQGNLMRAPLYLHTAQPMTAFGLVVGWKGSQDVPMQFERGPGRSPALLDTKVPGVVTAAWFQDPAEGSTKRVVLGYLTWDRSATPGVLQILTTEARGENGKLLRLETPGAALQ